MAPDTIDFAAQAAALLAKIPGNQQQAAGALITQYGPELFKMAQEDAWAYIRRLMAGDLDVVLELDAKLSDDAFIAKVKANTAAWENVVAYNVARKALRNEIVLKLAPVILSILAAMVGL